ncbi:MAG: DNA translocase FtsK 4TM domain-containing protein [Leadbetterella sp.]
MANNFRKKRKSVEETESIPKTATKKKDAASDNGSRLLFGGFLFLIALVLIISFVSYLVSGEADQDTIFYQGNGENINSEKIHNGFGSIGAKLGHQFIYAWFGLSAFLLIPIVALSGYRLIFDKDFVKMNLSKYTIGSLFYLFFIPVFTGYFIYTFGIKTQTLCGNIGIFINDVLHELFGGGSILIIVFVLLAWMVFFHGFTKIDDFIITNYFPQKPRASLRKDPVYDDFLQNEERSHINREEEIRNGSDDFSEREEPTSLKPIFTKSLELEKSDPLESVEFTPTIPEKDPFKGPDISFTISNDEPEEIATDDLSEVSSEDLVETYGEYDPKLDLSGYMYPPVHLLAEYPNAGSKVSNEELEANKNRIVETINNFSIGISSIKATIGPTVTLYEIVPDAGVRISKIKNLEDDIALSLAALGIRIIAPMPGKGTIGIEVPNKNREMVSIKSVVGSEKFQKSSYELPIILGKTISNEIYIADLAKMPHLLMAGATGQGKSVGLNVILTSLLYKKHPADVKFVLVDPKKVELTLFNKIERHFLAMLPNAEEAIITDTKKVINTMNSLCIEMDQRYDLLKDAGVRNIKEYNAKFIKRKLNPEKGHKYLPYIILVIDELADLMMTAGKEVEQPIARLAQLARAIGIHLIVATQRPSVNVITGLIKANFPARLSFKVTAKVDSRTIMDTGGAEQLVGNGDMLLSMGSEMVRLQCPFVDTPEVESICEYIGEQKGLTAYLLPEFYGDDEPDALDFDPKELDPMFDDAARLLVINQQGSTSLIQRKMKLGYNRAGRIIDQLEGAGIVGPFEGSKAREVLIKDLEHLEEMLRSLQRN